MPLPPDTAKNLRREFDTRLQKMLTLIADGRAIEILLRILDQTREGLSVAEESYDSLMVSALQVPNLHPKQAASKLTIEKEDREKLLLGRDIADKVAHGLFRQARQLIDSYGRRFPLSARINAESVKGWSVDAKGMLIEEDGRRIVSIRDSVSSSDENLIVEEFDLFVHNGYYAAAREIFAAAKLTLVKVQPSLAIDSFRLQMFRGLRRGVRTYSTDEATHDPVQPASDV